MWLGGTLNSSAANFRTAVKGVPSGTLRTLKGNLGSDVRVILNVTLAAIVGYVPLCTTAGEVTLLFKRAGRRRRQAVDEFSGVPAGAGLDLTATGYN